MMGLFIAFDDMLLKQHEKRGPSALFTIYWQQNGISYPTETWMDFGTIILGWWTVAILKLIHGDSPQELYFMDGPFKLSVELANDQSIICTDSNMTVAWTSTLGELVSEIKKASERVIRHLSDLGVDEKQRDSLALGLSRLTPDP
jgi:hypothetical protein